jgi:ferric-dicitrate binding protein FerR (iron transport regulator)
MPTNEQLQALLDDYVTGAMNDADKQLLLTWLSDPAIAGQAGALIQQELESGRYESDPLPGIQARLHARLQAVMDTSRQTAIIAPNPSPLRRLTPARKWWAAAAILLLVSTGVYQYFRHPSQPAIAALPEKDTPPGSSKAVLTLANGTVVALDSAGHQAIRQGFTTILQQGGELRYDMHGAATAVGYNTLATPRGGQFQVSLPDGTKVWLNAASSIKYPTAFTGSERKVELKGEAYFEVASRQLATGQKMPFKVIAANACEIEVLGTHFNINSYDDEPAINTTLLEGKVKVVRLQPAAGAVATAILSPGQQAQLDSHPGQNGNIRVISNCDTDGVMAWKNGTFNFENKSLEEVMRQLSRWYDIDVVYEGKVPPVTFAGEMGRDVHLSKLLVFLRESRVRFRMEEGKKLIILN